MGHCFPVALFTFLSLKYVEVEKTETDDRLIGIFCKNCEFYADDCDFHNISEKGSPCGGYIYFLSLIDNGIVSRYELEQLCKTFKSCVSKKA